MNQKINKLLHNTGFVEIGTGGGCLAFVNYLEPHTEDFGGIQVVITNDDLYHLEDTEEAMISVYPDNDWCSTRVFFTERFKVSELSSRIAKYQALAKNILENQK